MITDQNKVKRKVQLKHVTIKRQEISLSKEMLAKAKEAEAKREEPDLNADQQAILFICQRGHQSFISIFQGVNSTRIPIGKPPINEENVRLLLDELETNGYLSKTKIHDQPTWTATPKAKELET